MVVVKPVCILVRAGRARRVVGVRDAGSPLAALRLGCRLLRADRVYAACRASAGLPAVTTSNWPTVSRPKSNGMKAPIATTISIAPKKIAGEPVYGSIKKGARTPAKTRPVITAF